MSELSVNLYLLPQTVGTDVIITMIIQETLIEGNIASKDICMNILRYQGILVSFMMCLSHKTDPSCPTKHENYWIDSLNTKAPIGMKVLFKFVIS